MATMSSRSTAATVGLQMLLLVLLGLGLAVVVVRTPLFVTLGGLVAVIFVAGYLQRPDLGLLCTLVVRTATDIGYVLGPDNPAGEPVRLAAAPNALLVSVLVLAGGVFLLRRHLPLIRLPGGVLLTLLLVSGFVGVFRSGRLLSGLAEWLPVAAAFVAYGLAASQFRTRQQIARVVGAFAASLVAPAAVGFLQWTGGAYFAVPELGLSRVSGTFAHPNAFAIYLVLILSLFLAHAVSLTGRARWGAWCIVVVSGTLLGMTFARVGWVGALIVVAVIGLLRSPLLLAALPVAVLGAVRVPEIAARLADPFGGSFADRVLLWQETLGRWLEITAAEHNSVSVALNRFVGLGPGAVGALTAPVRGIPFGAHNDYLALLVEYGIFGLALYLVLLGVVVRLAYHGWRASREPALKALALGFLGVAVAYPVVSLTDHVVGQTSNQLYFWTLAGLVLRVTRMASVEGEPVGLVAPGREAGGDGVPGR
jgi:putative inorganic carbon (HCO3(-)) transporter